MKHWFLLDVWPHLDYPSLRAFGAVTVLGMVTKITANEVSLFFTVAVGLSATIYNIVKTKIELDKQKDDRRKGKEEPDDD